MRKGWLRPKNWGISVRSALVAGTVVFVALTVAAVGLATLSYRSLLSGFDSAAAERVGRVESALETTAVADLGDELFTTGPRIIAVQVVAGDGTVVRRSESAPATPLTGLDTVGERLRVGIPVLDSPYGDIRVSAGTVDTDRGQYTVMVGEASQIVDSTLRIVGLMAAIAAPVVILVSAAATFLLVRRSLRSVDAIRSRVAEISTSDLGERVPVPAGRDEIAALAVTMNEMLARLEAGHAAQQRFVGDASHELRSPLAVIISALEMAAAHPELMTTDLAARTLIPEAHRMQTLIEDLLLLARADERGLTLDRGDVDLEDLVAEAAGRLRETTGLSVGTDLTPTRVAGDRAALTRAVRNLLDNAGRHAQSRVDVSVQSNDGQAVVIVDDDGPGIPEADRRRVFDRFVRLDPDRSRSAGGAGLGLAIVAEIVAAHGGTVEIADRPGGGARFRIQLAVSPDSN